MIRFTTAALALLASAATLCAQPVLCTDEFDDAGWSGALWGNERGNWQLFGGVYGAISPTNMPPTFTSLPWDLTDLEFECDVVGADDGGVWLHADDDGLNGVLLVTARGSVYWHNMVNGDAGAAINQANGVYTVGSTIHIRAVVSGDSYSAYVNGNLVTTHTYTSRPSGRVGLYDFRHPGHNYDNIVLRGVCASGDCCPVAHVAQGVSICPGASGTLHARIAGSAGTAVRWQAENPGQPGQWNDLVEGEHAGFGATFTGVQTSDLLVQSGTSQGGPFVADVSLRCVAGNPCGASESQPVIAEFLACCPDVNQDGNVDQDDVTYLINVVGGGENPAGIDPDFNADGNVDQDDVSALINTVGGGGCP
ncbi:MAG: hypothetical protein DYG92_12150 [Leptolyngbya sp. PLA1]|nr:hypothetical protein [Leptolyngbya sp. PLA1]